jgi:putative phosphoribosyl transferase
MRYVDRVDAGRQLARRLSGLKSEDVVVLGLPRGGVPVGYEVEWALDAPLDVLVVRKLGVPFQSELGMGARGEDGVRLINPRIVRAAGVRDRDVAAVEERERLELNRRVRRFRGDRPGVSLAGRTAVVVDDGMATGFTAWAACQVAREHGALRVILAVPVAAADAAASTGAAAALWAATEPDLDVAAVVSRGGRPDLAADRLRLVRAPTLLIVGGRDRSVLDLNRQAMAAMRCECGLRIVPDATHLFEDPGALGLVAAHARDWFRVHL